MKRSNRVSLGPSPTRSRRGYMPCARLRCRRLLDRSGDSGEETHSADAAPAHWDYGAEEGPSHWASLDSDYEICGDGKRQSPININAPARLPTLWQPRLTTNLKTCSSKTTATRSRHRYRTPTGRSRSMAPGTRSKISFPHALGREDRRQALRCERPYRQYDARRKSRGHRTAGR